MLEIFNTTFKKIIAIVLTILFFGGIYTAIHADNNRVGACVSCCTAAGTNVCKPNFTKALCREYNQRNVEGRKWKFVESPSGKCP